MKCYLIPLFLFLNFFCPNCNCEVISNLDFGSHLRQHLQEVNEKIEHDLAEVHERIRTLKNIAVPSFKQNVAYNSFRDSLANPFENQKYRSGRFGNLHSRFRSSDVRNIQTGFRSSNFGNSHSFGFRNTNIPSTRDNIAYSPRDFPLFGRGISSSFRDFQPFRQTIGLGFRGATRQIPEEILDNAEDISTLESDERDSEIPSNPEIFLKPSENEEKLLNFDVWTGKEDFLDEEDETVGTENPVDESTPLERLKRAYVKMPTGRRYRIPSPRPKHWSCRNTTSEITELKPSGWSEKQYTIVKKEMENTIVHHSGYNFTGYNIIKIEKIANGCLWKRYRHQQNDLKTESGIVNQRMLWHGTKFADDIVNYGFNEQYSSMWNMFGTGIYFAKHSSKANQYVFNNSKASECPVHHDKNCKICERKLILARVSLGKSKVVYTMERFSHAPAGGYRSVTALPSNHTKGLKYPEFVIYRGEQAYPEYLITYTLV